MTAPGSAPERRARRAGDRCSGPQPVRCSKRRARGPYDGTTGVALSMRELEEGRTGHRLRRCEVVQTVLFGGSS